MAKSRKSKGRRGRPRNVGPLSVATPSVALSLPPTLPDGTPQVAPVSAVTPPGYRHRERPPIGHPDNHWWLPDDSKVRAASLQIIAMRIAGMEDEEIAKALGISKSSISPYIYRATKNGWLDIDYNPKDRLQYVISHKIVQRLEEGLDSEGILNTGMKERTHVALKMAEGTIFKAFDQVPTGQQANTVVSVQVVMPDGPRQTIREDTTGGTPAFIDADVEG